MSVQKIVIHRYNMDQPETLLEVHSSSKNRFAEFAGGTAAECAVVCCCIPLSLVNLFVLAVYGVPKGLFRKALRRKRRRRLLKKGSLDSDGQLLSIDASEDRSSCDGAELLIHPMICYDAVDGSMEVRMDAVEFEEEMWKRFYGTGFWRSGSQRVD